LAVDVGGTFTDAVLNCPRGTFTAKTPTTPADQSEGVIAAAEAALSEADQKPESVDAFIHGMTVTTNAMLEGKFAKTALLTTAGFSDLEEIGRQNRADLYRLGAARPAPIVPAELRFGLNERCGPDGPITPLDPEQVKVAAQQAADLGARSLAICLLFSFRHPEHELLAREAALAAAPDLHISLSHEVVGTFREYERLATTVLDAALAPLLSGYLARLTEKAAAIGLPEPQVMLSNGGTVPAHVAGANASWTVLSGPAGGAVGAARATTRSGHAKGLAFDMGGTSTDISLTREGEVSVSAAREVAGRPLALPAVDVTTVGAGGGSIAWRDRGGALRVGPQSAGASPGPACYGQGGGEATVSDANLLLGYLSSDSPLAGGLRLNPDAAEQALSNLGEPLGLDPLTTAAGVIEIANLEMLRAMTTVTIARGIDPREYALVAFGGAGPMHACAIAEALEIGTIVCPSACGVLSAWGMSVSGRRRDLSRSIVRGLDRLTAMEIAELTAELAASAARDLGLTLDDGRVSCAYELRYRGQAFELAVSGDFAELATLFHAAHEQRFGFSRPDEQVELVTLRVSVAAPTGKGEPVAGPADPASKPQEATREAWFDGTWQSTPVFGAMPDEPLTGPALIELPEATLVVRPGWRANAHGADIVLQREAQR
jgi:N-methylhydantoinase A